MLLKSPNKKTLKTSQIKRGVEIPLSGKRATFYSFADLIDGKEHVAIVFPGTASVERQVPLVRMHSECLTGDVFHSGRCDCGEQLNEAIDRLAREGGILLYLRQEGRGIGLYNKLEAYALQLQGLDTYEANRHLGLQEDLRDYQVAAQMLAALGIKSIRLLSNNPDKRRQLQDYGIEVAQMIPTGVFLKDENKTYLQAKVEKTGHQIGLQLAQ